MTPFKESEMNTMLDICDEGIKCLINPESSLDEFGELLNEQWKIKRNITEMITNKEIDEIYTTGLNAGALGGKLLGAGGGGFILFYVPINKQKSVKSALKSKLFVPFRFDFTGSKIIYYSHQDI